MYAAERDDAAMVEWLLTQWANVQEKTGFGDTALHEAASYGAADACRILLAAGADVNAETETQDQPISGAATLPVVHLLVEAGADINFVSGEGIWPLLRATSDGDVEMVRGLLALDASMDTTSTGETALHEAVKADELEIMRLLLTAGADPNAQDVDMYGTLWFARTTEAVQILLESGVDVHLVDEMGREALQNHTDTEIQAQLISAGCFVNPPDTTYGTPMIRACDKGSLEQVKFLLTQGAEINAATSWGKTALMEACEHNFSPCVQALLAAGAGVEAHDEKGRTAAFYAAAPEAFEAYQSYLRAQQWAGKRWWEDAPDFVDRELMAQVEEIVGPRQIDPADYGYVASDSTEVLEMLAQAGANLNARDAQNWTPLMLTASCGRPARVARLLALGADAALRDSDSKSARDLAEAHPDSEQREAILHLLT